MDLSSYLPAVAQHGLITHRQALAAGLSPRDIARLVGRGEWSRLRKGVYVDGAAYADLDPHRSAPLLSIHAAQLAIKRPLVFTHDSSAVLHRLGVPDATTCAVHIARPEHRATRTSGGIVTHGAPFGRHEVVTIDGLMALCPARTALDMVRFHGLWPGLAACDAALRSGATRADLAGSAERMRGWPHKTVVDRAIELADPGSESYLESLGRGLVIELGVGTPQTQFILSDGHRTVRGDIRVGRHVFEIDGKLKYFLQQQGRTPEQVLWEEKLRQDFITGFKLGVSRITWFDCHGGRRAARQRLAREYADTVARFGADTSDLAPYTQSALTGW
ncbi:MAG: type IV toxin-antitoxin system AbiEi family antitoxin domain-containing protein [Nocardioides sp.]|nr:type IV toxin-antitoxin system AbiEi family antitoxin domain-containing protein [Nocardioides sp.]